MVINLASQKKMAIVEYLLEKKIITQYQVKKDLGTGMSVVNQTFKFLEEKEVIQKANGKYEVIDPENLVELIAFFRNMSKLKIIEINTSLEKQEVINLLPESVTFCMETALEKYSNYYKTNTLSFYANSKIAQEIKNKLAYKPGNKTAIVMYKEKPELQKVEVGMPLWKKLGIKNVEKLKFTTKIRTIIDLYSGKKGNAAEVLVKHLWGKK